MRLDYAGSSCLCTHRKGCGHLSSHRAVDDMLGTFYVEFWGDIFRGGEASAKFPGQGSPHFPLSMAMPSLDGKTLCSLQHHIYSLCPQTWTVVRTISVDRPLRP